MLSPRYDKDYIVQSTI